VTRKRPAGLIAEKKAAGHFCPAAFVRLFQKVLPEQLEHGLVRLVGDR
jgi:hypothetical protein